MREQDKAGLATLLVKLHTIYGGTPTAGEAEAWYEALEHHELRSVTLAVARWIRGEERIAVRTTPTGQEEWVATGRYFPKPAEIITLIWASPKAGPQPHRLALPEAQYPGMAAEAGALVKRIWSSTPPMRPGEIVLALRDMDAKYPGAGWGEAADTYEGRKPYRGKTDAPKPAPAAEEKQDGLPF